jgi:hypothetical protein
MPVNWNKWLAEKKLQLHQVPASDMEEFRRLLAGPLGQVLGVDMYPEGELKALLASEASEYEAEIEKRDEWNLSWQRRYYEDMSEIGAFDYIADAGFDVTDIQADAIHLATEFAVVELEGASSVRFSTGCGIPTSRLGIEYRPSEVTCYQCLKWMAERMDDYVSLIDSTITAAREYFERQPEDSASDDSKVNEIDSDDAADYINDAVRVPNVRAEYEWLAARHPGAEIISRRTAYIHGVCYDIFRIREQDGTEFEQSFVPPSPLLSILPENEVACPSCGRLLLDPNDSWCAECGSDWRDVPLVNPCARGDM